MENVNSLNSEVKTQEAAEVKHMLELTVGSQNLVSVVNTLDTVKADSVLFYPTKNERTCEENGKTVYKRWFQVSKSGTVMAAAAMLEASVRVFGYDGEKAVKLAKVGVADMKVIFSAKELLELSNCISGLDTQVRFAINTTDSTCTVDINAGKKDGVISAINMLPLKKEAVRFDLGGKPLGGAVLKPYTLLRMNDAVRNMTADAQPNLRGIHIGFGGPGLKWFATNERMVTLGEVPECELSPAPVEKLVCIEKDAFDKAAHFCQKAAKCQIQLIGKETKKQVSGKTEYTEGMEQTGKITEGLDGKKYMEVISEETETVPNHIAFTAAFADGSQATLTVQLHDPNHTGGFSTSVFENFKRRLRADDTAFEEEESVKARASFLFDRDELILALNLMKISGAFKGLVQFGLENGSKEIMIKEYSKENTGRVAHGKIRGNVSVPVGLKMPCVFVTKQLTALLNVLHLKELTDENGKVTGREKVRAYVKDSIVSFTGGGDNTYVGVTVMRARDIDAALSAEETKKEEETASSEEKAE